MGAGGGKENGEGTPRGFDGLCARAGALFGDENGEDTPRGFDGLCARARALFGDENESDSTGRGVWSCAGVLVCSLSPNMATDRVLVCSALSQRRLQAEVSTSQREVSEARSLIAALEDQMGSQLEEEREKLTRVEEEARGWAAKAKLVAERAAKEREELKREAEAKAAALEEEARERAAAAVDKAPFHRATGESARGGTWRAPAPGRCRRTPARPRPAAA